MSPDDLVKSPSDPIEARADRLAAEMAADWARGETWGAEDYLARDREVSESPRAALRVIYEEFCLHEDEGREIDTDEFLSRFPRWRSELETLLGYHCLLTPTPPATRFPEAGESLGDFQLLYELGRGALGRVFLAAQGSMADRPVVLKVVPIDAREHLTLARLQQTYIIPINGIHDFEDRNIRALCMPYYGGSSLDRLLESLEDIEIGTRSGAHLLEALDRLQAESPIQLSTRGPGRNLLIRSSFAQAMCWIGASLADALHHAHQRELVHLDIKTQNVLLTIDGQPMLLDFHLAHEPIRPEGPAPAWIGGTPASMSPEQEEAMEAIRTHRKITRPVDARSDIFSLGLLLYQSLGGPVSLPPIDLPRLSRLNPQVSEGLAAIIHKCLEPEPSHRYPDAAMVATDLRLHLADRPLKGVSNRSLRERWRKLRKRQPHAPAVAGMMLGLILASVTVGANSAAHLVQRRNVARLALADGGEWLLRGRNPEAIRSLTRGLQAARGIPGMGSVVREIERQLRIARRGQDADHLHSIADRLRFLYGAETLAPSEMKAICRRGLQVWDARARLLDHAGAELPPGVERQIANDLTDLLVLSTDFLVRLAPVGSARPAHESALRILDEAESVLSPTPLLDRERRVHAGALGRSLPDPIPIPIPMTSQDATLNSEHCRSLGLARLRSGDEEAAILAFERALEMRPASFWTNYYLGICTFRLGRLEEAERSFRICEALKPGAFEASFYLARVLQARGQTTKALAGYNRALALDPNSASAMLNRASLRYQANQLEAARADFEHARALGADPAVVASNLKLVARAIGTRPGQANGAEKTP